MADLIDIVMPASDQEGTESVISSWFKAIGESIEENEPLLEVSTDKVMVEVPAPCSGVLKEIAKNEGDEVQAGDLLGRVEAGTSAAAKSSSTANTEEPTKPAPPVARPERPAASGSSREVRLSPAVQKLLSEHNIESTAVTGTGAGGRITTHDVKRFLESGAAETTSSIPSHRIKHTPMRKSIAAHMVSSMLETAPHVTAVFEADMSNVIEHRKAHKPIYADEGLKLTFTPYFVQAAVAALKEVPEANSRWHHDTLEVYDTCNIGIATAIEGGLIVPVLKDAQTLDLKQTVKKLELLVEKARANKLTSEELVDGTFTITNHGMGGSLIATPIINQPQSAILGLGKLEPRPTVTEDGHIVARPKLYVTLTIDHRVLDGFKANQFLSAFVETLENWEG